MRVSVWLHRFSRGVQSLMKRKGSPECESSRRLENQLRQLERLQNLDAIIDALEVIEHGAEKEIVQAVSAKWKGTREGECIARIIETLE